MDATDLDEVFVSDGLEFIHFGCEFGKFDVDASSETCAKVGGACSDVTEVIVLGKLGLLLNLGSSTTQPLKHFTNVTAFLHGDNPEFILLVDPDEECLSVVVEYATSFRPVSEQAISFEEPVIRFEQEMIIDQLLPLLISQ